MIPGIVAGRAVPGDGSDPYWAYVVSLLNFAGNITDAKGLTWAANGGVTVDANGAQFDGAGDYLSVGAGSYFGFSTGAFCVETLFRSTAGDMAGFDNRTSDHHGVFLVNQTPGGGGANSIAYYGTPGGIRAGAAGHETNDGALHHYAWTRDGSGIFRQFVDGEKTFEAAMSGDFSASRPGRIGGAFNSAAWFNGTIRAFRVTKGVPRYTSNFTAPSWPFPMS